MHWFEASESIKCVIEMSVFIFLSLYYIASRINKYEKSDILIN